MGRETETKIVHARAQEIYIGLMMHIWFDIIIHVFWVCTGESLLEHFKIGDGFLYVPYFDVLYH